MTERHFKRHNPLAAIVVTVMGGAMFLGGCATNMDGTKRTWRNRAEEAFGVARGGQMDVPEGSYMRNLPRSDSGVSVTARGTIGQGRETYGGVGVPGVDEPIDPGVPGNVRFRGRAGVGDDNYTDGDVRTTERRRYRRNRDNR